MADFLGFGLLAPFRRDGKSDFAAAGGDRNIASSIRNILGTRRGELRWRPDFGSQLYRLKHMTSEDVPDLGRFYAIDALSKWEPRIVVQDVLVEKSAEGDALFLEVLYSIISQNVSGNQVVIRDPLTIPLT
jgi:phage baseplate assembly protein W